MLRDMGHGTCPTCGGFKQMYYVPWCPRCDKPTPHEGCLNMIQALTHIAVLRGEDPGDLQGYKRRVWLWLCDNVDFRNDTTAHVWFPDADDPMHDDLELLRTTFGLPQDGYRFEFSW